jgi:hypothetical protein
LPSVAPNAIQYCIGSKAREIKGKPANEKYGTV